jgi:uncharacterized protein (DUF2147 family)
MISKSNLSVVTLWLCLFVAADIVCADSIDFDSDAIIGRWTTERGSIVQVEKSGEQFFGVIISVAKPTVEQREEVDRENPENIGKEQPDFDTQDKIGVQVLYGIEFQGKGVWKGTFYNDRRHKNFNAKLTLEDKDNLRVRITALVEKKQTVAWTRLKD